MSADQHPQDTSELQALLSELCEQQEITLLGLPSAASASAALDPLPTRSERSLELSVLERHILTAHRYELAELLWQRGQQLAYGDPVMGRCLNPASRRKSERDLFDKDTWSKAAQDALSDVPSNPALQSSSSCLRAILDGQELGLVEVARVGYSLTPLDRFRRHEAIGYESRGDRQAAWAILEPMSREAACVGDQVNAHAHLGRLAHWVGTNEQRFAGFEYAGRNEQSHGDFAAFWLQLAIFFGHREAAEEAMERVEEMARRNPESFAGYVRGLQSQNLAETSMEPEFPSWLKNVPARVEQLLYAAL